MNKKLIEELKNINDIYTLSSEEVKKFIEDFCYGLKNKSNGLKMLDSFLYPIDTIDGEYISIDFGGSNIRINLYDIKSTSINLIKSIAFSLITEEYNYTSSHYTFTDIFNLISDKISEIVDTNKHYYLGHTFSFAIIQTNINNAYITHWTKNFNIREAINTDINRLLTDCLAVKGVNVTPCVILNDTVATLLTGNFLDSTTDISCIAGTGHNMAFIDKTSIINIENGFFNKLRLTDYDKQFITSPFGSLEQLGAFVGGKNIGNLAQIIIDDLVNKGLILPIVDITSEMLSDALIGIYDNTLDDAQKLSLTEVAKAIFSRSSKIVAAEIYAIVTYKDSDIQNIHNIVFDGSIYEKVDYFRENLDNELKILFKENISKIHHSLIKDSSSMGAALAASMYHD